MDDLKKKKMNQSLFNFCATKVYLFSLLRMSLTEVVLVLESHAAKVIEI